MLVLLHNRKKSHLQSFSQSSQTHGTKRLAQQQAATVPPLKFMAQAMPCVANDHLQTLGSSLPLSSPSSITSFSNLCIPKKSQQQQLKPLKRHRKQVRFHSSSKDWDGLRPENALMQRLVVNFFRKKPNLTLLQELFDERRQRDLLVLCNMLGILLQRIKRSKKSTPLLPGGSRKSYKLNSKHISRVERLFTFSMMVYAKCVETCKEATSDAMIVNCTAAV